jgi:hypothetical protein
LVGISKRQETKQKKWQVINKQVGKCSSSNKKIELKTETGTVTKPQNVEQMLNAYFVETVAEIFKQNNYPTNTHIAQPKIEYFPNYICVTYY